MFQTAYGSLTTGLDLKAGQTLLIRGGTSTVGLSAATIAKELGATVLSTTRSAEPCRRAAGGGRRPPARRRRRASPTRFASSCRTASTPHWSWWAARSSPTPSALSGVTAPSASPEPWRASGRSPTSAPFMIPDGVRLTSYGGQAADLPADVFARQLQAIAEGRLKAPVAKVYHGLEQVREAQADVESGTTPGKHVVVLDD